MANKAAVLEAPTTVKIKETKQDKFVRLAKKRVPKAIKALRLVAALGKYAPSVVHQELVIERLSEELSFVSSSFNPAPETKKTDFAL